MLHNKNAEIFIPDGTDIQEAIKRTTHMGIGAHQDDLEIMAYHGIQQCFQSKEDYFFGCIVTNGSGSARESIYKDYTDEEMVIVRCKEQKKAAYLGEYGALALLDYRSKEVKDNKNTVIISELANLIKIAQPQVIYTHNLADKHSSHIGVVIKVIKALRSLQKKYHPKQLLGCEVWRDLDWMNDNEKVCLDVSKHPNLASSLVEIFNSQIVGGKRYDLAAIGRRLSNATYNSSHTVDETNALSYAMDLTPLIEDDSLDIKTFIEEYINRFKLEVMNMIDLII